MSLVAFCFKFVSTLCFFLLLARSLDSEAINCSGTVSVCDTLLPSPYCCMTKSKCVPLQTGKKPTYKFRFPKNVVVVVGAFLCLMRSNESLLGFLSLLLEVLIHCGRSFRRSLKTIFLASADFFFSPFDSSSPPNKHSKPTISDKQTTKKRHSKQHKDL